LTAQRISVLLFILPLEECIQESVPSFTAANLDLLGLEKIERLDKEGLYFLATCIVVLRAQRIVCQSILPGILGYVQNEVIAHYGTSNNCKQIKVDNEVNDLFTLVIVP